MTFDKLLDMIRDEPYMEILFRSLRALKLRSDESATTPIYPELREMIEGDLAKGEKLAEKVKPGGDVTTEQLDAFLHKELGLWE